MAFAREPNIFELLVIFVSWYLETLIFTFVVVYMVI